MNVLETYVRELLLTEKRVKPIKKYDLDHRLENISTSAIVNALRQYDGNVAQAAKSLGVKRTTLYYRMNKFDIDYEKFDREEAQS